MREAQIEFLVLVLVLVVLTVDRCVLHKILEPATPEVESALDSVGIEKTRFD